MRQNLGILLWIWVIWPISLLGANTGDQPPLYPSHNDLLFSENKGQWSESIKYLGKFPNGKLRIESNELVYVLYHHEDMERLHHAHHGEVEMPDNGIKIRGHVLKCKFPGAQKPRQQARFPQKAYENYYLGNNPERWASHVRKFGEVFFHDLYPGIDYRLYSRNGNYKYDFIVQPHADVSKIGLQYEGAEKIKLTNNTLYVYTSVNEIVEQAPIAFQYIDGVKKSIPCKFVLKDGIVGFEMGQEYDANHSLVIDPTLIFSSYTGSSEDNWGYTATYDDQGNLYGGGIVFMDNSTTTSYALVSGSFQTTAGGGLNSSPAGNLGTDMGISKFSSNGSTLLYSTYLGGSRNEVPHSLVVNGSGELIVFGTTCSNDFPVTSNAYDTSYNSPLSGASISMNSVRYQGGSDIVLSKFNINGTALLGSTYIGGSGFDGITNPTNQLKFNYGDEVRGEVFVDNFNNCYVATSTNSSTFPTTIGSFQPLYGGGAQDGIVIKMDSAMSNMLWASYIGGSSDDAAYSVQIDGSGTVYVAGGTRSLNFPTTLGALNPSPIGGTDGFVAKINSLGTSILASTRVGTNQYDQTYFVQLDDSNNVYVVGQTEGNYPIFPATVFNQPFSGQFIHKFNNALDSTKVSTTFGTGGTSGNVSVDITLSAFLVNDCNHIYVSGWGGPINSTSTTGLTTTTGAHKTSTDGQDFYLIVLDKNADSLLYATFFGGTTTTSGGEHVDGGTSRFDKKGIVYQAVCAGCGGSNSFPTSPNNVVGPSNGSNNCNLGVIKFDLSQLTSDVGLATVPKVCIPDQIQFENNSNGGNVFFWDFGDGNTSTAFEPSHTYVDTGIFTVMLVVSDSLACVKTDTAFITLEGVPPPTAVIDTIGVICPGDSIQLQASGGEYYKWTPALDISNDSVADPFVFPSVTQTYQVVVSDTCGSDTNNILASDSITIEVEVATDQTSIMPDDSVCAGESIQLYADGGVLYSWYPSGTLKNAGSRTPIATPLNSSKYYVNITDGFGCLWSQEVIIEVLDTTLSVEDMIGDTVICKGDSLQLFVESNGSFLWYPAYNMDDSSLANPTVWPETDTIYYVDISNICFSETEQVEVRIDPLDLQPMEDTSICPDGQLLLTASGAVEYAWSPQNIVDVIGNNFYMTGTTQPVRMIVTGTSLKGCSDTAGVNIDLTERPFVNAGSDIVTNGEPVKLIATGEGEFIWNPADFLDCPECQETGAHVSKTTTFTVILTDENGCQNTDQVVVAVLPPNIFAPNSFTPNSDGVNDGFRIEAENLRDFELTIFNRWGQLLFTSKDFNAYWDGKYKNELLPMGVYVWKLSYTNEESENEIVYGKVNLLK